MAITRAESARRYRENHPERARACKRQAYRNHREKNIAKAKARNNAIREARNATCRPMPENCELCGSSAAEERYKKLHWDHKHSTGQFRGWLCLWCNTMLGRIRESTEFLMKAKDYIENDGPKIN